MSPLQNNSFILKLSNIFKKSQLANENLARSKAAATAVIVNTVGTVITVSKNICNFYFLHSQVPNCILRDREVVWIEKV